MPEKDRDPALSDGFGPAGRLAEMKRDAVGKGVQRSRAVPWRRLSLRPRRRAIGRSGRDRRGGRDCQAYSGLATWPDGSENAALLQAELKPQQLTANSSDDPVAVSSISRRKISLSMPIWKGCTSG